MKNNVYRIKDLQRKSGVQGATRNTQYARGSILPESPFTTCTLLIWENETNSLLWGFQFLKTDSLLIYKIYRLIDWDVKFNSLTYRRVR